MACFLKLDKDENLKCDKEIKNFLNPDYIYIPFYNNYKLLKKNHDNVTLDEPIFGAGDDQGRSSSRIKY